MELRVICSGTNAPRIHRLSAKRAALDHLRRVAASCNTGGTSLLDDPLFAARVAHAEISLLALEFTLQRALSTTAEGDAPASEASTLKILATENAQQITELFVEAAGPHVLPQFADALAPSWATEFGMPEFAAPAVSRYLLARAQSIYGGSNEVQRNIIANALMGR